LVIIKKLYYDALPTKYQDENSFVLVMFSELLVDLFESYDDARTCERQMKVGI
jgi:hypothetical protein